MDYSNFVRNFYRKSLTELRKFRNYYGTFVNVNKELNIPEKFLHIEENQSKFLPDFSLNIDSPTKYFIIFMDYYINLMPQLGIVFANAERINDLYNNAVDMGTIDNDEEIINYINFVINVGVKTLIDLGIIGE